MHEGAKLTCIFDCCHSGTVLDLRCNYRVQISKNNIDYNIHIDKHYQPSKGDIIFISGCKDDQTSADAWEENKFQGAMTYCLLKTIENYDTFGNTVFVYQQNRFHTITWVP